MVLGQVRVVHFAAEIIFAGGLVEAERTQVLAVIGGIAKGLGVN